MKKNFVRVMLFGALALSTVTYVGCKDYDDDIDNLQTQIDANKAGIAELQAWVKEGKWVTSVEDVAGGFKITFNDGKYYTITSGSNGKNGSVVEIGSNGNWFIDGVDTGKKAQGDKGDKGETGDKGDKGETGDKGDKGETGDKGDKGETGGKGDKGDKGEAGENGKNAYSPKIVDGYWFYYNDVNQAYETTGIVAETSLYVVKNEGPSWTLHVRDEQGEWAEGVILPTAGNISSLKAVSIDADGVISTDGTPEIIFNYGVATSDIEFNGVTYKTGDYLISPSAVVNAMINPANTDFSGSDYKFKLEDSKGKSVLNISEIKQNKSVKPLQYTRATVEEPTVNKGIYDLVIALNKGSKVEDVEAANKVAYALSTKDAWGNEIISDYDIKVKTKKSTTAPSFSSTQQTGAINESLDLNKLATDAGFDSTKVVAFKYELTNSPIQDVTFDETNKTIKSTKGQTVNVKVCYLTMTGEIYDGKERAGQTKNPFTFDIKFTQTIDVNFKIEDSFNWVAENSSLAQQSLALTPEQMKPIIDAAGSGYTAIASDKFTTYNTEDAYFTVGASNALAINIKRGFKGAAKAKVEIEVSDVLTINVVVDVEVAYMSDVTLMPSILWDTNKKVGLPVIYDFVSGEKLQAVNLGLNLVDLFDNYGDMKTKVVELGGEIEHVATPEAIASSISGTNFEFDAKDYTGGAITVTSQVKYGEDAVGENNIATFILRNPTLLAGTLTVPSVKEAAHEITNTSEDTRKEPVNLTTGFKWLDGRSTKDKEIQMWPTLATEEDGTTVKYYAAGTTSKGALAMYGLKVTYAFDDKDADTKKYKGYFDAIDQEAGTVKLTDEAAGYPTIGQDINVRIIATATCPWMDLGDKKETVLTVTVKAW